MVNYRNEKTCPSRLVFGLKTINRRILCTLLYLTFLDSVFLLLRINVVVFITEIILNIVRSCN